MVWKPTGRILIIKSSLRKYGVVLNPRVLLRIKKIPHTKHYLSSFDSTCSANLNLALQVCKFHSSENLGQSRTDD